MTECAYEFDPSGVETTLDDPWTCPRSVHGDAEHCLFHLPPDDYDARDVTSAAVRAALLEAAESTDPERKRVVGARFGALDLAYVDVEAADQRPLDLRHATVASLAATNADFEERVRLCHATLGDVDLRHADFEDGLDCRGATVDGAVDAFELTVEGDADFTAVDFAAGADFDEADFRDDAYFADATFRGPVRFRGARFRGSSNRLGDHASFARAEFHDAAAFTQAHFQFATFDDARFEDEAVFEETEFEGDGDFPGVRFDAVADFDEVRFREDADFSGAAFEDDAVFRGAEFRGDANHVEDNATFADATFATRADFDNAVFTSASFEDARFGGHVDFTEVEFLDRIDFAAVATDDDAYVDFTEAVVPDGHIAQPEDRWVRYDLTEATLGDVSLSSPGPDADRELLDYFRFCDTTFDAFDFADHVEYLERNAWDLHTFDPGDTDVEPTVELTPAVVEKTYLKAKTSASAVGNNKAAGEFRVKRQRFARRVTLDIARDSSESLGVRARNAARAAENYFLDVSCGHGLRLVRIAAVFFLTPLLFAFLYTFGGPAFETGAGRLTSLGALATTAGWTTFFENVYFSYVTYTTIGYGGIGPIGWAARVLAGFEAYLSAILAALVVYALVKRSEL